MGTAPIHKWTENEIRIATDLRRIGKSHAEISALLGRPIGSVRGYLNRHHIGPDRGARHRTMQRAQAKRNRDYSPNGYRPSYFIGHVAKVDVPTPVIAGRDRRANERAEQDLTARYFNDPPPSQSALARSLVERVELVQSRESLRDQLQLIWTRPQAD